MVGQVPFTSPGMLMILTLLLEGMVNRIASVEVLAFILSVPTETKWH
jgi:hypothetical protein